MRSCYSVLDEGLSDAKCVVWRYPKGYGGQLLDPLDEEFEELLDPDDPDCPLAEWFGDVVVMQSTGLKDKNGKEIFEGDVIESQSGRAKVAWNQLTCGFDPCCRDKDGSEAGAACEIVGNIHENPALLPAQ
jgi:hypothetical protein